MSRKLSLAITLVVKVVIASLVITSFWMIALIKLVVKVVIACFWMIVQCNISSEGGGLKFLDDSCYF